MLRNTFQTSSINLPHNIKSNSLSRIFAKHSRRPIMVSIIRNGSRHSKRFKSHPQSHSHSPILNMKHSSVPSLHRRDYTSPPTSVPGHRVVPMDFARPAPTPGGYPGGTSIAGLSSSNNVIRHVAEQRPMKLTLAEIVELSSPDRFLDFARFIWREIPIRISHRIVELQNLPYNLSDMPSIVHLRDLYVHSFHLFRAAAEPNNEETRDQFVHLIEEHYSKLNVAVQCLANGIVECVKQSPTQAKQVEGCPFLNNFLDRFHSSRIGTRLLTGQLCALHQQYIQNVKAPRSRLGLLDDQCSPKEILQLASDNAAFLCEKNFGKVPVVSIQDEQAIKFTYIPQHLYYMLFEILKNSMRAVCEANPDVDEYDLPPIEVVIVGSNESHDVTIKISDQGGGIPKDDQSKIWFYSFSTVPDSQLTLSNPDADGRNSLKLSDDAPMAGFGYGLPLSRLHSRYFGGDLEVISMDGYGTDAFFFLPFLITGYSTQPLPDGELHSDI